MPETPENGVSPLRPEGTFHGRSYDEWQQLISVGTEFLIERARLRKVTTYTEMNATLIRRTGIRGFDFDSADERAAMGYLLGEINDRVYPTTHVMISAIVHYLDQNDAGPGFYGLAQDLGLIPKTASANAKWEFWIGQVKAVHGYYGKSP